MSKRRRKESDVLGSIRENQRALSGDRLRNMECLALSRANDANKTEQIELELCACREWGKECKRGIEKNGIVFCPEKKEECVARGKERR